MADTSIEWTDKVWNPVRGCRRVSAGCERCYAERMAHRFSGVGQPYEGLTRLGSKGPVWTGKARVVPEKLGEPLSWKKPRRIFVNSMSDLFHEDVPDEFIAAVFAVMSLAKQHTFQLLTKRPERMGELLRDGFTDSIVNKSLRRFDEALGLLPGSVEQAANLMEWPLPDVWLGVSVEDQATADERIPLLLETPAAVRWLSMEPLLGPVDLSRWPDGSSDIMTPLTGSPRIDWVVVGGESGPNARPMHPAWARDIRDQCVRVGVPFHFKQWGEWAPHNEVSGLNLDMWSKLYEAGGRTHVDARDGSTGQTQTPNTWEVLRVGKKAAGRILDGRTWDEWPEGSVVGE